MAQNENISLSLADRINILNKTQSLDAKYGVYDTEAEALLVMQSYGLDGRLVAVYSDKLNGEAVLYMYNKAQHILTPVGGEGGIGEAPMTGFDYVRNNGQWVAISNDNSYFLHEQNTPSATWVCPHNLGKIPIVDIIDSANQTVVAEVTHDSVNQTTIAFSGALTGKAIFKI